MRTMLGRSLVIAALASAAALAPGNPAPALKPQGRPRSYGGPQ
jgi:hypothetical protein